jgi:hypothetical protein
VKRPENGVPVDEKGVQIVAGPVGRKSQPTGINVIRTFFERRDEPAQAPQSSDDADGKDGFPRPPPQGGDNDAWSRVVRMIYWNRFQKCVCLAAACPEMWPAVADGV